MKISVPVAVSLLLLAAVGCRQDMHDQPKYKPLAASDFFPDGRAARPIPADTVSRDGLRDDEELYTGKLGGKLVETFPVPITRQVLLRGQERFNIFCSPCHGPTGDGRGIVVRRGFPQPNAYHIERLRKSPPGYFFDVITNGFGRMQDYSAQIPVRDRWAIVAYVRVLQRSQDATLADVPPDERARLEEAPKP